MHQSITRLSIFSGLNKRIIFLICTLTVASAFCQEVQPVKIAGITPSYYNDTDKNKTIGISADLSVPLSTYDLQLNTLAKLVFASDLKGTEEFENILFTIKQKLSDNIFISAGSGVSIFEKSERPIFLIDFNWNKGPLKGQVVIERSPLYQTANIIRNEIMYYGLDSKLTMHIAERFSPKTEVTLRSYSDNNDSMRLRGDLPITFLLNPVKWSLGYRQEYVTFRRQSRSGYFDPDSVKSYQLVTMLSGVFPPFSFYVEAFGGIQQVRRFGASSKNNFMGVYSYARVDGIGPVSLILDTEVSDYSLASASGFHYFQVNLRAEANW